jgi:hypothetical protein
MVDGRHDRDAARTAARGGAMAARAPAASVGVAVVGAADLAGPNRPAAAWPMVNRIRRARLAAMSRRRTLR